MDTYIIEARDLSKHFGGLRAVDGVNLQVREGSLHSIIGPNGAGKTTLFNLISGNLKPTRGRVFLRGRDITGTPLHRMAHMGIGRSFQITNIFPNLTVLENARLAAQAMGRDSLNLWSMATRFRQYEEAAMTALKQVGLSERAGQAASILPHGDKRKLELAILLAAGPQVLLLDEPTAGMASEQVPMLLDIIRRIREDTGKTILLVEHNMGIVMNVSDRITVMHQGSVLAEGTPDEIRTSRAVQEAYLGESYTEPQLPGVAPLTAATSEGTDNV
ncbi:MAG TPA: ABC transporter ATP-binding protein [Chloroflexia bacterium]|nr:ABC transporter ATP-binding protein [Chloroflexia bacterium]